MHASRFTLSPSQKAKRRMDKVEKFTSPAGRDLSFFLVNLGQRCNNHYQEYTKRRTTFACYLEKYGDGI